MPINSNMPLHLAVRLDVSQRMTDVTCRISASCNISFSKFVPALISRFDSSKDFIL